jgi:Domain of unknown function (DUF4145)
MGVVSAHCNRCGDIRNHDVLKTEQRAWEIESFDTRGIDTYDMLSCSGCREIKLRHTALGDGDTRVAYYPPATFRPEPRWMEKLWLTLPPGQEQVHDLLKQVYVALQNGLLSLAAMGIRAVVETVMVQTCGDCGSFAKNLKNFEELGFVSRLQRIQIESVLEIGHATIHRGFAPSAEELAALLDITEQLLQVIYLHSEHAALLQKRVSRRKRGAA